MATSPCNSLNVTPILNSRPSAAIGLPDPRKHQTRREHETGAGVCVDDLIADFARAVRTDFAPVASRARWGRQNRFCTRGEESWPEVSKTRTLFETRLEIRLKRELGICFELVFHTPETGLFGFNLPHTPMSLK